MVEGNGVGTAIGVRRGTKMIDMKGYRSMWFCYDNDHSTH